MLERFPDQLGVAARHGDRVAVRGDRGAGVRLAPALAEPADRRARSGARSSPARLGAAALAVARPERSDWLARGADRRPAARSPGRRPASPGASVASAAETERLLDIQSEEILYSNNELEKKFRDLETKIEQLSLLIDLAAAVNATLDVEKIYEQALDRLVHRMGYQAAYLFLVDPAARVVRGHRRRAASSRDRRAPARSSSRSTPTTARPRRVAATGLPVVVDDVEATDEPVDVPTAPRPRRPLRRGWCPCG